MFKIVVSFGIILLLSVFMVFGLFASEPQPGKNISRIAFGSCAHQDKPQPIWNAILNDKPELFVFLGDNIYADTSDIMVMRAKYAKMNAVEGFAKLRKSIPLIGIWDDHDFGKNDAGEEFVPKDKTQVELLDFFEVAKDSPRRTRKGVYESWELGPQGKKVQIILLDTRYFRSAMKKGPGLSFRGNYVGNSDPGATVLGDEQWKWLEEKLRSPADLRIIGSSIQVVSEDHGFEKWMNFPNERERLYKLIKDTSASGVLFLSGDRHLGEISVMDAGWGYPVIDVTSSGINQANTKWRREEPNKHRFAAMPWENNYGIVDIDWQAKDSPLVSISLRNEEGKTSATYRIPLKNLKAVSEVKEAPVGAGAISSREAAKLVGEKVVVEFEVKSTGQSRDNGKAFINSLADFRAADNFTVVLDAKAFEPLIKTNGVEIFRKGLVGKRIKVEGMVSEFQGKSQIELSDPKSFKILEK